MYWNQKDIPYACCQLLTAINAIIFLGASVDFIPSKVENDPNARIFELFVDLTKCRHGACIGIYKAWYHLRLNVYKGYLALDWIEAQLCKGIPVGLSCFSPDYGYHSVLCIGMKRNYFKLVNWEKEKECSNVYFKDIKIPKFWESAIAFSLM